MSTISRKQMTIAEAIKKLQNLSHRYGKDYPTEFCNMTGAFGDCIRVY